MSAAALNPEKVNARDALPMKAESHILSHADQASFARAAANPPFG
jgi:hypothetical protein